MRTIILFIFLWVCQSSIGLSQTVIQMKKDGGVSVIPCKVNGLPLSFVFDTGASEVSISMTEALFMFKNGYLSEDDIVGTQKFSDATGGISEGIVINLKEIDIAGFTLHNVSASIVKNADAPLLLGQSAISKLGTFQLDLAANTLTIIGAKNTKPVAAYPSPKLNESNSTSAKPQHAEALDNPISPIIGNSITLGNLEIAEHDFDKQMTWQDAKTACAALGYGWRLPTDDELNELYKYKDAIGGFAAAAYWSSSEFNNYNAWYQNFLNGYQHYYFKYNPYYVRAVRAFK